MGTVFFLRVTINLKGVIMRINYANRKNDKNLIEYDYLIKDSQNEAFKGKITLIIIDKVKSVASVKRPNGNIDILEDSNYKIMTFFPEKENYSMTVFYDNNYNLLQWYFDIAENNGDYEDDIPYCFQRSVSVIQTQIYNYYLKYCFDSSYFQSLMEDKATGTAQRGFYLNQLEEAIIPLPPLVEQHRIVAKIEELLSKIDKLKTK
jgi:hypothetical protein